MSRALFLLELPAHRYERRAEIAAHPVTAPVYLLQFAQKFGSPRKVPRYGARLHISDAFPGFRLLGEISLKGGFGLDQFAIPSHGPQAGIDRKDDAFLRVTADDVDQPLDDGCPERLLGDSVVGQRENQVGIGS